MNKSKIILLLLVLSVVYFSGCSTVPLEPKELSESAKSFNVPPKGKAGIYVYRDSFIGQNVKKYIFTDNKCLGITTNGVFFYTYVEGDKEHIFSSESEFSDNDISLKTYSGKNYYLRQYMKIGLFTAGAGLEIIKEKEAQKAISKLNMAVPGICNNYK